jgi:hypothetical protein
MRRTTLFLAARLALALIIPGTASATCGAEGCPCVPNGLSSSRFAFDVRTLDVTQDRLWRGDHAASLESAIGSTTVHHGVPLLTRTRTWSFEGRMQVNDRLRLSASLPYLDREHRRFDAHTALANDAQHGGDSWTEPTASDPYRHPAHGGSRGLYLTPGANVSLPGGMGLYAAWQNRVWGSSGHAEVVARNYLLMGLSFSQRD